jgi:hypothetical protein
MWHPTARLRFVDGILQQQWVRMDFNPEIAEGMPHEGAREWRDVPGDTVTDWPRGVESEE